MRTRTKIVCTIGPAVSSLEKIFTLIDAGMDVARINFSHGDEAQHLALIQNLKEARRIRRIPLAIMLDTKGPEIRIGAIQGGQMGVAPGQRIEVVGEPVTGNGEKFQLTPSLALDHVEVGMQILFADGYVTSRVVEKRKKGILIEIQNAGVLKTHNNATIPNLHIDLPAMTEADRKDLVFGCQQDIDMVAASFIRSAEHLLEIKKLLAEQGKSDILVIAKIENSLGVQNFSAIVKAADGIMVARGDLGVELPLKKVPGLQKMMIHQSIRAGKPVITATQMLESMIQNPRPTRAEVSDVANAIYDSTSAVMLSGETAVGKYPTEVVKMMQSIVEETEADFDYRDYFDHSSRIEYEDISSAISVAAVKTAYSAQAKAFFVFTQSGSTARLISRFRPEMPIVALTQHSKVYHQMALNWGVIPIEPASTQSIQEAFSLACNFALKRGLVEPGDLVVVTAGTPFGVTGSTNMMFVERIPNA